jgi:glycogen debranching enzyme
LYGNQKVTEEIFLPDELNELIVRFHGVPQGNHELIPWVDMRYIWDTPKPEYRIFWEKSNNLLLISRTDNPFPKGQPRWLAITANVPLDFVAQERFRPTRYPKDAARRAMAETFPFTPGRLTFAHKGGPVIFVFILGRTDKEAARRAEVFGGAFDQTLADLKQNKLDRVGKLVSKVDIPAGDGDFQKAFRWALVSMDNLIMNQRGRGIYAGFHWFPNYWGRDSFICLPGACLSTKRFDVSREIILSFVEYQQADPSSKRLGRFPNIVNPENLQYAGVDGTWWLVRASWKHLVTTGDPKVLADAFPHIRLAIEGALEKAVDEYGYLTHGNGETWMDAGGETNPYSPRGDRAVEVQALFHHGLLVGAAWARTLAAHSGDTAGDLIAFAGKWETHAAKLRENFRKHFRDGKNDYLYDYLNTDGTPDYQIRPNAILALWVSLDAKDLAAREVQGEDGATLKTVAPEDWEELIPVERARAIVRTAMKTVVLPHGVTSLDPEDPAFRPYHLNLNQYYYDAAYHNGDVWEWLTGPMVTCMRAVGEEEAASKLIEPLVDEILNQACVGSLREIQDGVYTKGKEEFGGATSQAWSLAEFIRVCLEK